MEVFKKGDHIIFGGDTIDVLSGKILDNSIDLIFADPPYNIGKSFNGRKDKWESDEAYLQWCYSWFDLCIQKLKDTGSFYLMAATQNMPYFDLYLRQKIHILSRIVWYYDSSGVQARSYFGSLYEPILFCVKNKNEYTFNSDDILVEAKTGAKRRLIIGNRCRQFITPTKCLETSGNFQEFVTEWASMKITQPKNPWSFWNGSFLPVQIGVTWF